MSKIAPPRSRVVFCWSDISGYMAACWRALHAHPNLDVFVVAFQARTATAFADQTMAGIPCRLLDLHERQDASLIRATVLEHQPTAIVIGGWFHPPYRQLAHAPELADCHLVMGMDTPWRGDLRQRLAPWLLRAYLRRMTAVVVTGERSWQYARRLGVPPHRIHRGLYGVDAATGSAVAQQRALGPWPRAFLFVGRYVPDKGLDTLLTAYARYRQQVTDPWPLHCCGKGPLVPSLLDQPGIHDHGFVQPDEIAELWRAAGGFILPSRFDPWPLALVEAAAAGLPILCTTACGSAVEVVRDGYNGYVVPENDAESLARGLLALHRRYTDLPVWGARSQQLAAPYAAERWAEHWAELLLDLHHEPRT
jgi:glycosyltransferase involved in cell wall biosynthesis